MSENIAKGDKIALPPAQERGTFWVSGYLAVTGWWPGRGFSTCDITLDYPTCPPLRLTPARVLRLRRDLQALWRQAQEEQAAENAARETPLINALETLQAVGVGG